MWWRSIVGFLAIAVVSLGALPASGDDHDQPEDVILAVTYVSDAQGEEETRHLTLSELKTLPVSGFRTSTIWTDGISSFRGVWLSDLMSYLKINQGRLTFSALNEYTIEIPLEKMFPGGAAIGL